ncbi:RNA-binding domain-containing protein [Lactimicrobium massiliense]|uniref:RNA-binding domain-containing protein n=1 Tax=Lactimicrobium massiliense TaxID=2161814 RepID=UPI000D5509F9|nr:RNA-binding domain-containing protein [Lactimicrobium massiliense]
MDVNKVIREIQLCEQELKWCKCTENWFDPVELGEYISEIANSAAVEGRSYGYFVWGINDQTHEVTGTKFNPNCDVKKEPVKHFLARQLSPDVNFRFEESEIDGKKVVLLVIPAARTVPVSFGRERYIRIGSSKENLRRYPEKESYLFEILRHGKPTIENTPSQYQDLTFEKLLIYYGAKGIKLNPKTFKKNLSFYTEDGRYNLLAQLLSDNSHMPLRVSIFSGSSKADKLYSVREFGYQCLLYTLDEVLRYGDVLNIIQADETNRVVERKDVPLFENAAFREAVINAFVHNLWVSGNEPMISVFSDRIEILSRGTIDGAQTMEGFFAGESVPVNRKLSEIFLQLHISEKTGRGVPVITKLYGREAFEFRENSIVVKIPFHWINVMGEKSENKQKTPKNERDRNGHDNVHLSQNQQKILDELEREPGMTKQQLMKAIGVGKTTIDRGIAFLKGKRQYSHV